MARSRGVHWIVGRCDSLGPVGAEPVAGRRLSTSRQQMTSVDARRRCAESFVDINRCRTQSKQAVVMSR